MMLDRDLQRRILGELAEKFPAYARLRDATGEKSTERSELYNLYYLRGHGLVEIKVDDLNRVPPARITAAGLDFLADDGGLRAILGVVTVRLHDDTIRELLISKVEASNQPAETKRKLIETIRALPADGVKAVSMALIQSGIAHSGDGLKALWGMLIGP